MQLPSSSLIISTYNWPEALLVSLSSAFRQTILPKEIIVADDGSGDTTRSLITRIAAHSPVPLRHIWHEDQGFRLAHIRNKAIAAARGDYIIQIDGDILMHRQFVADHLRFAKKNSFVRASRIFLSKELSCNVLENPSLRVNQFMRGTTNFFSGFHLPLLWGLFETSYKNQGHERYEIHGCNMAYWKSDAIEVNGFNEDFNGWGPEDKEFVARLLNSGKQRRFLKNGGIAYHLYHPENSRNNLDQNMELLQQTIEAKRTSCSEGINKYIS